VRRAIVDDAVRESSTTVTVSTLDRIVREWLTMAGKDFSDIHNVSGGGHPRLSVSYGNVSSSVQLPVHEDAHPDDEIPVTKPMRYYPTNAPPQTVTVRFFIDDLADRAIRLSRRTTEVEGQ